MKVLFIGQNPSKYNTSKNIPFVGTRSHTTLKSWIEELGISSEKVAFVNASSKFGKVTLKDIDYDSIKKAVEEFRPTHVVCLGRFAEKAYINYTRANRGPILFYLPHPSSRNRILNNSAQVRDRLRICREYLTAKDGYVVNYN